ncbi:MAG: hypothetical protein ACRCS9_09565 [Hyphomicrobium sp.]
MAQLTSSATQCPSRRPKYAAGAARVVPLFAPRRARKTALLAIGCALSAMIAGCAGSNAPEVTNHRAGLSCIDDSHHCISQRERVFDQYMADKSRAWVRQPATPEAYASGVRLFALTKRRKDLSCDELAVGKREADAGPGILRSQMAGRITPAQVSRSVMLSSEVARDLGRELDRRCRKT